MKTLIKRQLLVLLFLSFIPHGLAYADKDINFMTISDIHLNINQKNLMQIDPSGYNIKNDMDKQTFLSLMFTVGKNVGNGKLIPKPRFILWLGDIVAHTKSLLIFNRPLFVKLNESNVLTALKKTFPDTPIINIFGNNDSFEKNYGDYTFNHISAQNIAIESGFKNGFLSTGLLCNNKRLKKFPCLMSQNTYNGYFTVKLENKLLLIGLNSVMFSTSSDAKLQDIQQQFNYLTKQLAFAKKEHMSVLLAMHIPTGNNVYDGSDFWKQQQKKDFLKIINRYQAQIKGLLVAHTHMEELKVITLSKKNIGEYFTAGLSTSHGNSPSIKVFSMKNKKNGWAINNYTTYQIHKKNGKLQLSKYYDFSDTFCKRPNSVMSIDDCLSKIKISDIFPYYTVNNPNFDILSH